VRLSEKGQIMDISETTAPRSDQQNYDDYAGGITKTVTVTEVKAGSVEQPVEIHLGEYPGRPYKPSKSMRRVLVACWGPDSSSYIGRRLTLIGDPTVKFGGSTTGGIKISHLSNLDKPVTVSLTVTRGKRAPHTVQPLPDAPAPRDWASEIALAASDLSALEALGKAAKQAGAGDDVVGEIRAAYMSAKGGESNE
jgi:hypothetical protein